MDKKQVHIIGGGTINHIASHLAVCAPYFGGTARKLEKLCHKTFNTMDIKVHMTKMAGGNLETNDDVSKLIDDIVEDDKTKIVFMPVALVDFGSLTDNRNGPRYSTHVDGGKSNKINLELHALPKIVDKVRKKRKDIFLIAFKHTSGLTEDEQYIAGLNLCKRASANLVLANDSVSKLNMIITPEEARYCVTTDRDVVLNELVEMAKFRSHLTFTRSTVVGSSEDIIPWDSDLVPSSLRKIVDYCIEQGAYKPFNGSTVGHFAVKLAENTFLSSIRRSNFNDLKHNGLVKIITDSPDSVMAYGAKPSVGGQSQRIVFHDHTDYDCIVHFHCPIRVYSNVPIVSQREFECGSHQCGENTSNNLKKYGNLSAVYLDQHGPNIVFHHSIDPQEVIDFINKNFNLSEKTGGFVSIKSKLETSSTLETAEKLL